MKINKLLKKFIKRKISFSQSLLVTFLITGGVSFASIDFYNYTPTGNNIELKTLTETEDNQLKANGGIGFISYTKNADNTLTPNYYTYSYNHTFAGETYSPTLKTDSYIDSFNDVTNSDGTAPSNFDFKIEVVENGIKSFKYYTVNKNTTSTIEKATERISTNLNGVAVKNHFVNLSSSSGGAIFINTIIGSSSIGDITGDFIGNYVSASSASSSGGAIYNNSNGSSSSSIGDITGDFIGNYVSSSSSDAASSGGAISNSSSSGLGSSSIGDITGNFIGNYVSSSSSSSFAFASGGAISNRNSSNSSSSSSIGDITGNFIGNYVSSAASAYGGAIFNSSSSIGDITGDFIGNYVSSSSSDAAYAFAYGGAIYNSVGSSIGDITGDFIGNYVSSASSSAYGGAIYNSNYNYSSSIGDITGDFIGNYALGTSAQGGAIYNNGILSLVAKGQDIEFTGNYTTTDGGTTKISNAIHSEDSGITNLLAENEYSIIFNDNITGTGTINIGGDRLEDLDNDGTNETTKTYNGTIVLNNDMSGYLGATNFKDGTIEIGANMLDTNNDGYIDFFAGNFVVGEAVSAKNIVTPAINAINNKIDKFNITNWTTNSELGMGIDINANTLEADSIGNVNGQDINFSKLNIIYNDDNNSVDDIKVFMANTIKIADGTDYSNLTLSDTQIDVTEGIYDYTLNVLDDKLTISGELSFEIPLIDLEPSPAPPVDPTPQGATDYNDNVLQTTVALGGYATNISNIARRTLNNTRKHEFRNSVWVDTYGADENIKYSTAFGEKEFDNEIYSITAGVDFEYNLLKGFEEKGTVYFGHYNGTQKYNSIDIDQEGYYVGVGTELTKGNAYIHLNAMYGMSKIEEVGRKYDANSLSLGVKIGEEYKVTDKIFIEPNVQLGYHMISADDYTNKNGVAMSTDTLGVYNITQELKFTYKGEEVKPYMMFSYNVNGYTDGNITATKGTVSTPLPMEVGTQSYFEGKVGVSKRFLDNKLNVYGELIGTLKDNDSFGAQVGLEYKF